MTLPTFNEVWSKYLFNQSTPIPMIRIFLKFGFLSNF
jgi:hypothetical protein